MNSNNPSYISKYDERIDSLECFPIERYINKAMNSIGYNNLLKNLS